MRRKETYALYRGDELVDVGTRDEVAARQGIKPSTVVFYASPSYRRRVKEESNGVIAVRVDD